MENIETTEIKTILYQESDPLGHYRYQYLFSDLSNIATTNAIEIGIWDDSLANKYGWILVKQTLKLKRPINIQENITIKTRAESCKRIQANRAYEIVDGDNSIIGGAFSTWTLIDLETRLLTTTAKAGIELPTMNKFTPIVDSYHNINIEATNYCGERTVKYSDIDVNQHMNNSRYIEWALDLIDYDLHRKKFISEMNVHYLKEMGINKEVKQYLSIIDDLFCIEFKDDNQVYFKMTGILKDL